MSDRQSERLGMLSELGHHSDLPEASKRSPVKLHTTQSSDEMFLCIMQSWADTAAWIGAEDSEIESWEDTCHGGSCERDMLLHLAMSVDETVPEWPHWMAHELSYLLLQLKLAIQDQALNRPHYGATVERYFLGSGNVPKRRRMREMTEVMEIMDLNSKMFYLWVQNRLVDLGAWPRKVYTRRYLSG